MTEDQMPRKWRNYSKASPKAQARLLRRLERLIDRVRTYSKRVNTRLLSLEVAVLELGHQSIVNDLEEE